MNRICFPGLAILLISLGDARGAEPDPAVTVQLFQPYLQGRDLLWLFKDARAPHPPAALAAWKRATGQTLGKPREAVISLFNPAMIDELTALDDAKLSLAFDPDDGRLRWRATLPRDDGTFAALATALVLTDGAAEAPLDGAEVDRLGPPGSPLMARSAGFVALASSRDDLKAALRAPRTRAEGGVSSGIEVRIRPEGLGKLGPLPRRRAAESLRAIGCSDLKGTIEFRGRSLSSVWTTRLDVAATSATIDPRSLAGMPDSTAAVLAFAIDPSPEGWTRAFNAADRIERVDPARAGVAPLRARLNLIAMAAKVHPEVDLWPQLRGLWAALLTDRQGAFSGAVVALHAADPTAAETLEKQVLPRLIASFAKGGKVANRPLRIGRRGATVVIGWGESALEDSLASFNRPGRTVGVLIQPGWWGPVPPARAGAFWPGRWRSLGPPDSPWESALKYEAIAWQGRNQGKATRDEIYWTGLDRVVRRFLERLPMDPPPDRAER